MAAQQPYREEPYETAEEQAAVPAQPETAGAPPTESGGRESHGGTADLVRPTGGGDVAGATGTDTGATGTATGAGESDTTPLLPPEEADRFRVQWESVQVGFVDEPRQSVAQADELVAELMRQLAESFAQQRSSLEADWDRGEDVSTEDLRVTLQRYRSFFQRLLAA